MECNNYFLFLTRWTSNISSQSKLNLDAWFFGELFLTYIIGDSFL